MGSNIFAPWFGAAPFLRGEVNSALGYRTCSSIFHSRKLYLTKCLNKELEWADNVSTVFHSKVLQFRAVGTTTDIYGKIKSLCTRR